MIKNLLTFVLTIFIFSCSTTKLSHEYFSECEDLHNTFSAISKCGLNKVNESCINENDCNLSKDRFVNIIEQLNLMVTKKQISEDEAFFRYLNIINSFENDRDYLIVVDIQTGELLSKVDVNARLANGMFLTPGFNRDVFYCTTGTFTKVTWQ